MPTKAKSVADFLRDNDKTIILRDRITKALAAMLKVGKEHHEDERAFCTLSSVASNEIGAFRAEFKAHIAFVPKLLGRKSRYVWFADPKAVPAKFRYNPENDRE